MANPDREYPNVVVTAVDYLISLHKTQDGIGPKQIEKTIAWLKTEYPDVLDATRAEWLRRDLTDLVGQSWEVLTGPKSRGRRRENILGILRT